MFEMDNLNYLVTQHAEGIKEGHILIGLDKLSDDGIDLVAYDITEMLEQPTDIDDFYDIVNENALDEEEFEIDRVTFKKVNI